MKKAAYILVFLIAFGASYFLLPYFKDIENPHNRYVYAAANASIEKTEIDPADNTFVERITTDSGTEEIEYIVLRRPDDFEKYLLNGVVEVYYLEHTNLNYILAADIDFNGKPSARLDVTAREIGKSALATFNGVFNGNGYKIKNVAIKEGIFGTVGTNATVKKLIIDASCSVSNVALTNTNNGLISQVKNYAKVITTAARPSTAVGIAVTNGGTVTLSYNAGTISGTSGIVETNNGTVSVCSNEGTVLGTTSYAGGIVAINNAEITECINSGEVGSKNSAYAGGIVAYSKGGTVKDSDNTDDAVIMGYAAVGGIAGNFYGTIENCKNYGLVKAVQKGDIDSYAGGIAGKADSAVETSLITGCKNTAVIIGQNADGILGNVEDIKDKNLPVKLTSNQNDGRLNGRTEFTLKLDSFLTSYKLVIIAVIAVIVVAAIISIIVDRVNAVKNRRTEIDTMLYNL
ncbi:MAG: hypothetical protein LBT20_06810 [Clostridiales bacterium]|jgi:hypothetical protein|nr:hypothetical protein [Clostridiales bacterium]